VELVVDVVVSRDAVVALTVRRHVLLPPVDLVLGACSGRERQREQNDNRHCDRPPSLESQSQLPPSLSRFPTRASIRRSRRPVNSLFWTVSGAATAQTNSSACSCGRPCGPSGRKR